MSSVFENSLQLVEVLTILDKVSKLLVTTTFDSSGST
jgi:hypothetical protein